MATLSLSPVSAAVYSVLSGAAAVTALVSTRIYDDVPQTVAESLFPFLWYEVREQNLGTLGTHNGPLEVELRVHAFSTYRGAKQAQEIIDAVIGALKHTALTVSGFNHCGRVFYDETVLLPDEDVNGIKCRELVALFRIYVEAA